MALKKSLSLIGGMAIGLVPAPAFAASPDTWVSRTGSDTNSCTTAAPCATFQRALTQTAPGGTIHCADSGSYGPVSISQNVAIRCVGVDAQIAPGGGAGVAVNAAVNVVLDGLDIDGAGSGQGLASTVQGSNVKVMNTRFRNLATGALIQNGDVAFTKCEFSRTADGIHIFAVGTVSADVEDSNFYDGSGTAISAVSGSGSASTTVRNTEITGYGSGVMAQAGGYGSMITLDHSNISYNTTGVTASLTHGQVRLIDTVVTGNTTGLSTVQGGLIGSYGNNQIFGNATNGAASATLPSQ